MISVAVSLEQRPFDELQAVIPRRLDQDVWRGEEHMERPLGA